MWNRFGFVGLILLMASVAAGQDKVDVSSQALIGQAEKAGPTKMRELASQFEQGRGVPKDLAAAFHLYERAAGLGDTAAQVQAGYMLKEGRGTKANPQQAFRWFLRAASGGSARGEYDLAVAYIHGYGVQPDRSEGLSWLQRSANDGDAQAQALLGVFYVLGQDIGKDCSLARRWSEKAVKQGNGLAEFTLASADLGECDGRTNIPRAVQFMRQSAEHGLSDAQYRLGQMFAEGLVLPRDDAAALKWILASASQGNAIAQFAAGMFYEFGRGIPAPDYSQAVPWYEAAAAQNDPEAEMNLAALIDRGLVPGRGAREAVQWYTLAARQGLANAQLALATHYEHGAGVGRDLAMAAEWYRRAAPHDETAKARLTALLASHPELAQSTAAMENQPCSNVPALGLLAQAEPCPKPPEKK